MSTEPIRALPALLATLAPQLHDGVYVYARIEGPLPSGLQPLALFREAEGLTVIVEEEAAQRLGLSPLLRAAWITLAVHSDLQSVGLTAAFATALAEAGVGCNVVAAACHDHLFVPVAEADAAMAALLALQARALAATGRSTIRP